MKRIFIILLCGLCDLYAQSIIKFDDKCIDMDYKVKEIEDIVGKPIKTAEIPFRHNSDWDTICYTYPNLEIYSYRITGAPYKIKVSNCNFELHMNEIIIKSGESKATVEKTEKLNE